MTRRDQTARAWIARSRKGQPYTSYISLRGRVHRLSTGTHLRKAARDFNLLHLRQVLSPTPTKLPTHPDTQSPLLTDP